MNTNKTYKFNLTATEEDFNRAIVRNSEDIYDYVKNFYHEDLNIYESFFIVMLNQFDKITGYAKISQGGIVGTVVDIRIVAKYAIESLATSIILCHNHPSGGLRPSNADRNLTQRVKEALNLFEIQVLDHIIISSEGYYSFADEGII